MTTPAARRIGANDARREAFRDFSFPHATSHQRDRTDEVCDQTGEKMSAGRDDT